MRTIYYIFFQFVFTLPQVSAQLLTLDNAITIGLNNNYGIQVAGNLERIAQNLNTAGNAGFLPSVSTSANYDYSIFNLNQRFFTGDDRSSVGATNNSARVGLAINWNIFEGFRRDAVRDRLLLEVNRSRNVTESEEQNLIAQIKTSYYTIVRNFDRRNIVQSSIALNLELLDLAEKRKDLGAGTELEVLQTLNALRADSSRLLTVEDDIKRSKISLNQLLRRESTTDFEVQDITEPALMPTLEEMVEMAKSNNPELKLLELDRAIALTQIQEEKSNLYPVIGLNAQYNYNWTKADAGFLLSNQSYGPQFGITASYDLYQGRNLNKDIEIAELIADNSKLTIEDQAHLIESNMQLLYQEYEALTELIALETRNVNNAQRNTTLARQLYQAGRATDFAVREAILAEAQVLDRLADVEFRRNLLIVSLKQLAGIVRN